MKLPFLFGAANRCQSAFDGDCVPQGLAFLALRGKVGLLLSERLDVLTQTQ